MCNCSHFDSTSCKCHDKLSSHVKPTQLDALQRLREDSQFEEAFSSGEDAESNLFGLGKKNKATGDKAPKKAINLDKVTAGINSGAGFLNAIGGLFGKKQVNTSAMDVETRIDPSPPEKDNSTTIMLVVGGVLVACILGFVAYKIMSKK